MTFPGLNDRQYTLEYYHTPTFPQSDKNSMPKTPKSEDAGDVVRTNYIPNWKK